MWDIQPFRDRCVFITGATGGIGGAIAQAFFQEGAYLYLSGRNEEKLGQMKEIYGDRCALIPMDLSDAKLVAQCVNQLDRPIDILINNGGIAQDNLCFRMQDEQWEKVLQVNLTSAFYLIRAVSKHMMKKKWGRIVNISSVVGITGNPGQSNYAAAKAGLIGLTKTVAQELARWSITVNAIAPGYIQTEMTQHLSSIEQNIPMKRQGLPSEVAFGALFLSHPQSSYITGQTLHINGGLACF
jgi:3-oxoacyl-[acyl-carrier protein] reductase